MTGKTGHGKGRRNKRGRNGRMTGRGEEDGKGRRGREEAEKEKREHRWERGRTRRGKEKAGRRTESEEERETWQGEEQ